MAISCSRFTRLRAFVMLNCLCVSLMGMHITPSKQRSAIDPRVKKQLMALVLKRPEDTSIDIELLKKVPEIQKSASLEGGDLPLRNVASAIYFAADALLDFVDEIIEDLKQKSSEFTEQDFSRATIFNNLSTLFRLCITYPEYLKARRTIPYINYIQECHCLCRRIYPFRKITEDRIMQHIESSKISKDSRITITEFASGDLLELFVLVNRLIEKGYHKLCLNCIDTKYSHLMVRYIDTLQRKEPLRLTSKTAFIAFANQGSFPWRYMTPGELKKECAFASSGLAYNELANMGFVLKALSSLSQGKQEQSDFEKKLAETIMNSVHSLNLTTVVNEYVLHRTLNQFLSWFAEIADISLMLYPSAEYYMDVCKKDPDLKSDIMYALDWYPDRNFDWWDQLRTSVLRDRGFAITVLEGLELVDQKDKTLAPSFFLAEGSLLDLKLYEFYQKNSTTKEYDLKNIKETPSFYSMVSVQHIHTGEQKMVKKERVIREIQAPLLLEKKVKQ